MPENSQVCSVLAGTASGWASTIVCHPFDNIRTRLQTESAGMTLQQCISHVYRTEGSRGFYRGFGAPFLAQGVYKSVIFTCNNFVSRYIFQNGNKPWQIMISGAIAGAVNSFIVCPVELIRGQQIIERTSSCSKVGSAKNLIDCARTIYSVHGIYGFFRGLSSTILRDSIGLSVYFLTFVEIKKQFGQNDIFVKMCAGSVAGTFFWVAILPIDSIKSIIQSMPIEHKSRNISHVIDALRNDGRSGTVSLGAIIRRLYSPLPIAIARGIPGAAITLTTYDIVFDFLQQRDEI